MIKSLLRKLGDTVKRLKKIPLVITTDDSDLIVNRPVLLNSIPKSGTHLLYQVLEVLPSLTDKGEFIASIPSRPYRFRSKKKIKSKIDFTTPGELVRAHLFYDSNVHNELIEKKMVKYFIYRDPRDIVISEAMYLAEMNQWHGMSKYFRNLTTEECITLAIKGLDFKKEYPDINERVNWYRGWFDKEDFFKVKFENLIDDKIQKLIVGNIVKYYQVEKNLDFDIDEVISNALKNIIPKNSHTFRSGNKKTWKEILSNEQKNLIKDYIGDLLIELGYEENKDW